jgi:hypothetical protein
MARRVPYHPPRLRVCDDPDCRICRWNEPGKPPTSGHPAGNRLSINLLAGAVAIILLFILLFIILPAMGVQ